MEHIKLVGYYKNGWHRTIKEVQYLRGCASGIRENYKRLAEIQSRLDCYKKTELCIGGWAGYYYDGVLKSENGEY